jgi:hypothetical protein
MIFYILATVVVQDLQSSIVPGWDVVSGVERGLDIDAASPPPTLAVRDFYVIYLTQYRST